jgi:hypothetical protein
MSMRDVVADRRPAIPAAGVARNESDRAAALLAIGCLSLAIGILVYLTDRDPTRSLAIPTVDALTGRRWFGAIGLWLPSFVHTFSFSLLTAAALPQRATPRYSICAAWCAVNLTFEIGQHPVPARHLAHLAEAALGNTSLARGLANYFLRGTFDAGDIAAALLGAMAAAGVMRLLAVSMEAEHAG